MDRVKLRCSVCKKLWAGGYEFPTKYVGTSICDGTGHGGGCLGAVYEPADMPVVGLQITAQPSVVSRTLLWRGKRYDTGKCNSCGKDRQIGMPLNIKVQESGGFMEMKGVNCYRCLQRIVDQFERAASELRAACAGGVWEEAKLEVPRAGSDTRRSIMYHRFTDGRNCACGMQIDDSLSPITLKSAGLDHCPLVAGA